MKWGPPPWCVLLLDLTHQKASPLLWVRTRADLAWYLVDRGADGAQVTYWYHRQFVQVAQARYLSDSSRVSAFTVQLLIISCEEILLVSEIVQYPTSPYITILLTLVSKKVCNFSWSTTKFSKLRFKVGRINATTIFIWFLNLTILTVNCSFCKIGRELKRLNYVRNNRISRSRTILFPFCAAENTKDTTLIHTNMTNRWYFLKTDTIWGNYTNFPFIWCAAKDGRS